MTSSGPTLSSKQGETFSRSRQFLKGVFFGYGYQGVVILTGLWLTPFLLTHLGKQRYGLWLIGLQLVNYLMLADFGILMLLPRSIAIATGRVARLELASEVSGIVSETVRVLLYQSILVAIGACAASWWVGRLWPEIAGPSYLIFGAFAVFFPTRFLAGVLNGLQEQGFVSRTQTIAWASGTITNVLLLLAGWGLYALAAGWLVTEFCVAGLQAWRLATRHAYALPHGIFRRGATSFRIVGSGLWMSLNQLSTILINGSDIFLVGKSFGPGSAVVFSCSTRLISVAANQPQLFAESALPGLSQMRTGAPANVPVVVSALGQFILFFSGLLCCPLLAVNEGFISRWVGPQMYGGLALTVAAIAKMIFRHTNATLAYGAFAYGHERRLALTTFADGLLSVSLSLLLIPVAGLPAVLLGPAIGVLLVSIPANAGILAKETGVSVRRLLTPQFKWLLRISLVLAASGAVSRIYTPRTPLAIAASASGIAALYLAIFLPSMWNSSLRPYLQEPVARLAQAFSGSARKRSAAVD